jgi:hypothetical protein
VGGLDGGLGQRLDAQLGLGQGARVDEHLLEVGDLRIAQGGVADAVEQRGAGARRPLERHGEDRCGLALAEVVADGLARDRHVTEGAEDVVAQLERLAERVAVGGERCLELGEAPGEGGADVQRAARRCSGRT